MTAPGLTVRAAVPADFPRIAELTEAAYQDGGHLHPDYAPALRDVAARAAHTDLLVAELAGRVIGSVASVLDGGPYAELAGPGEASFRMLAVDPAAQGAGAGEALVRACLDAARTAGRHGAAIYTQPSMVGAHRLYAKLGFVRAPDRDREPIPGVLLWCYVLDFEVCGPTTWCDRCGRPGAPHPDCTAARELEPPRYCPRCGRRAVVQVVPTGWQATCSAHGRWTG